MHIVIYIFFKYFQEIKIFTQRSAVLCRVGEALQYSTLQCTANHQFAIQWSSMSPANWIVVHWNYKYNFLTVKWSALYRKEVQCTSMDKNVDLCSALEFITAHPRLTKSPKKKKHSCMFFSVSVLLIASVERFGVSRMRDFFYLIFIVSIITKYSVECSAVQPN